MYKVAKQISILFISVFIYPLCFAQTKIIDSLKSELLNARDTQQVNILNDISQQYFRQASNIYDSNLTISADFANRALQLSKQINYTKGIGNALFNAANASSRKENLHNAIDLFNEAIPFFKEMNDNKMLGNCLEIIADCTHELGDNQQAIKYYDSSIAVYKKIKDSAGLIVNLEWKGHSYFDMGDYKNAFKYGQEASELANKTRDTLAQIQAADHLANIFLGAGMPETALEYMRIITRIYSNIYKSKQITSWETQWGLLKAGEAYVQLGDIDSGMLVAQIVGFAFGDEDQDLFLGHLFYARHEYNKALPYYTDGFHLSEKSGHKITLARHANELSRVELALKNYKSALYYANKALLVAQSMHALLEMKNAVGNLADIYDKSKNYTKAYHFTQLYKSLSDSLAPEEYKRKLALIEIQHELDNQKQQAQLLAKENQLQVQQNSFEKDKAKKMQLMAIIIITASALIAVVIIMNLRLKRKKDQLQKTQLQHELELQAAVSNRVEADFKARSFELESQALRAQMNPHFIFNCLNSINRFIINNDAVKAADYLTKFAKLIRIVLEQSGKSFVPLEDELKCLQLYMDLETLRFETPFQYEINCNGTDTTSIMIPTLMIQPFVENAIWHGLQGNCDNGKININIHVHNNILHCKICDNGIGRQASVVKEDPDITKKSLGINLTQHRLQLIDASNQQESGIEIHDLINENGHSRGTCVHLKIPVKEM